MDRNKQDQPTNKDLMSEPTLDELTERMKELCEKATPGPWDADSSGQRSVESAHVVITDANSRKVCDTLNADDQLISMESDEDGVYYFEDGQRSIDMEFIATARTYIPLVIEEREKLLAIINCLKRSVSGSEGKTWVAGAVPTALIDAAMQKGD